MELSDYLNSIGANPTSFAEKVGVSIKAMHRYCKKERLPRPDIMARIYKATEGKVTPADFY